MGKNVPALRANTHTGRPLGTPDLWTPRNEFRAARWRREKAGVRAGASPIPYKEPSLLSSLADGATFGTFRLSPGGPTSGNTYTSKRSSTVRENPGSSSESSRRSAPNSTLVGTPAE